MKFLVFLAAALSLAAEAALMPTATGLKLERGGKTIWNLELDTPEGRPYFHPLCLPSGRCLTDCRPKDHVWHLGWWFSWKYLNRVNYWEPADAARKGVAPAGETRLVGKTVSLEGEGATVKLKLAYGERGFATPLLTESRNVIISAPDGNGAYSITIHHEFTALDACTIDRTPPHGSVSSGKWGGGYAGPTLRLSADIAKAFQASGKAGGKSSGEVTGVETNAVSLIDPANGEGITFTQLQAPATARFYLWPDRRFINASPVYTAPLSLKRGETLRLAYRLAIHGGKN